MKTEPQSPLWSARFAKRTRWMKRNAVRELLKVTNQPGMISFAGGLPAPELFPLREVGDAMKAVLQQAGPRALQYGETEGIPELRDWLARRFSRGQSQVRPENVLITTGSQQALDLIGRVLVDEGDRVIVENPTYLALLSAWRPSGAQFLPVASDADGMMVDELPPLLADNPRLIYVVPNFQNPQGTTLSLERRRQQVSLARRHGTAIVEDDPYGELRYECEALPGLFEIDATTAGSTRFQSNVIYTGTFSKTLMPGLRVGWVIAASELIEKLALAKQAADLHTSTPMQYLAIELIHRGVLDEMIPRLRQEYRRRRDAMLAALEKHFPDTASWTRPAGGMFLFVSLPAGADAGLLLREALRENVAFVPGEEFHLNGCGRNTLRLNFSNATPEQINIGIQRLGRLLQ